MIGSRSAGTPAARQTVSCAAGGIGLGRRDPASASRASTDHQAVESGAAPTAEAPSPPPPYAAMRSARGWPAPCAQPACLGRRCRRCPRDVRASPDVALLRIARRSDRQHPAGPARTGSRPRSGTDGAGQGRVLQPRRLGQGPDRGADDRGGRGVRRAEARRDDRRADVRQHRGRAWRSSPSSAATTASSSARTRSAATRSTRCARTAPRSSSARPRSRRRTRARTTRSPTGWPARRRRAGSRTSTPTRTTRARTTRRPARRSGSRPTAGSRTSWPASGPAARSAASGAT